MCFQAKSPDAACFSYLCEPNFVDVPH